MGDYLDSSLFELSLYFYDLGKREFDPHIKRKKKGTNNPFRAHALRDGGTVNLQQLIGSLVNQTGCKALGLTAEQFKGLREAAILYQSFSAAGTGCFAYCHWSVEGGLHYCEVDPNADYVRAEAVYYDPNFHNNHMLMLCNAMLRDDLSELENEHGKGRRFVLTAEDYPAGETLARYNAYQSEATAAWHSDFSPHFTVFADQPLKKKNVFISTEDFYIRHVTPKLHALLKQQQASVKLVVNKNIHYLLVDTEQIELFDHYAERRWRLEKGDAENAAKTKKLPIEKAIELNRSGCDIKIIDMQQFLNSFGIDYADIKEE